MLFKESAPLYASELERKQGLSTLYLNFMKAGFVPSLIGMPEVFGKVVDALIANPDAHTLVFVQQRLYAFNAEQTLYVSELARVYSFLLQQEQLLSFQKLRLFGNPQELFQEMSAFMNLLRHDPYAAYLDLKRKIHALRGQLEQRALVSTSQLVSYIRLLEKIQGLLEQTKLVSKGIALGCASSTSLYEIVFRPDILPNFTFTRLVARFPEGATLVDQYELTTASESITVSLLKQIEDPKYVYHIMPSEYSLSEEHQLLLNLARGVLTEHRPQAEEFTDPEKTRAVFMNVARDLLLELSGHKAITLTHRELLKLSSILVRHTLGFGLLEVLLLDERLQDIVINAPLAQNPIFVRHEKYGECNTNIIPSYEDGDSWAAKLRLQSGRPLDEANPILDTELVFGSTRARIAAIKEPLSPQGLAYALRRHRDQPWTLPLFLQRKMLNSLASGLLSFIIDGSRTLLIAGTRSSGKTSLLGSLLLEIMPNCRTIVVEDTLELPVDALREIGYDILRMKVRSALLSGSTEVEAAEGIRTSLRLGDSALIVGEVRSTEAKALYEAMRVGALANVVAGTIHGDSPYGVFDRVVNDLGVPATSFKATDIIVIANPVKSADGLHSVRRIMSITEVRKHWTKDPSQEGGFVDLMRYNVETDELEPTAALLNGDSELLKAIAGSVKGWAGNWDAVWDNILLRARLKQRLVEASQKYQRPDLLEAAFNARANHQFHRFSEQVQSERGLPEGGEVYRLWDTWLTAQLNA